MSVSPPVHPRHLPDRRRRFPRILRSSRGNVAATVAVSGSILVGMAGLATEGGRYYFALQDAQGAADVSAMAMASAYLFRGRSAALVAGAEVAGRNGYAGTEVTVRNPPASGTLAGNAYAFEVTVSRPMPITLGRTLLGRSRAQVSARAVSYLYGNSPVCILALNGPLTVQNSNSFQAPNCGIASNAPGASVVIPQSNNVVLTRAAISFGTCNGCNNTRWRFTEGYQEHAPPVTNPYTALDNKAYTTVSGASCINTKPLSTTTIQPTGMARAYCAKVTVGQTNTVNLASGTYVFQSTADQVASLEFSGTNSVTCNGCTFIFRGTNPGSLSVGYLNSATLTAPASNPDDADFDGILFHRAQGGAAGSCSAPSLSLGGLNTANLVGGIYFPGAYVKIGNLNSNNTATCLAVVGGTVELGSLNGYRFDVSGCTNYRTGVPTTRVARLIE